MIDKETAYRRIAELAEKFSSQIESYENEDYNETQTRRDFIDPFFKALGWDIDNEQGFSESFREVLQEFSVKIGTSNKKPDYAFRLGNNKTPLFFVEAKKPNVSIKDSFDPALQLRQYGWNGKLAVSILTNFKEFAVYDCTQKPLVHDNAAQSRIRYFSYKNYLEEFDFLWQTFGRENVPKGGLERFIKSDTLKRGTSTVDEEFLLLLENWRSILATTICRTNPNITEDELNFSVQQTINRIIFLRIAEDRGVESIYSLKKYSDTENCYKNIFKLFIQADSKYNSGLFDFEKDNITPQLNIENKIIQRIINDLYYPNPYNFAVLPVEILGNVYEKFLGKIIRLTSGHRVKVEEKPEVRKSGGVYYTPQYIVDYIVQNTVGKLVEGKTPNDVAKIKIVDPACGSGSFLLGAYQFLLDWHRDYYLQHAKPSKGRKTDPLTPTGQLSTVEKKSILLNNIFGVDIDSNAVEITKLSLLLKCMEGETEASIENTQRLFHEQVLPSIDDNIRNGNSLIDTDFYDRHFDFGDERNIKPFNWKRAFSEVFRQGGFDCVIGNPPYRTLLLGKKQKPQNRIFLQYYQSHYQAAFEYKVNLFALFIERSVHLLRTNGLHGFIVPNTFYYMASFKKLRKFLLENGNFDSIMNLCYKVFAQTEIGGSGVFVFSKQSNRKVSKIITVKDFVSFNVPNIQSVAKNIFLTNENHNLIQETGTSAIIHKIFQQERIERLGTITKIYQGIITGDNRKYLSDKRKNSKWKPILKGKDINRYTIPVPNTFIYYVPEELWSNTDKKMFNVKEKLISRQTSDKLIATLDREGYFSLDSTHVIHLQTNKICIEYLLGLYNSKLFNFLYQNNVQEQGRVFAQVKTVNLKPLPVKMIDFDTYEKEHYYLIVRIVKQLIKLYAEKQEIHLSSQLRIHEDKIARYEQQINETVYQLYDLTEDEIKMVEGK
jgi:type I restriction-modification system DNA methylase subunit